MRPVFLGGSAGASRTVVVWGRDLVGVPLVIMLGCGCPAEPWLWASRGLGFEVTRKEAVSNMNVI